jgi:hypothetical protein
MSLTIKISEESAELLAEQAKKRGLSVEAWIERLAREEAQASPPTTRNRKTREAAAGILALQKEVKPDPEGWTIHDYIDRDRR